MSDPKIEPLNHSELEWLARLLAELNVEGIEIETQAVSFAFERARRNWFASVEQYRPDPNPIINRFGAAVGQLLVQSLDLRWVVASDEDGTEMAVQGDPGDILLYPMNAVGKRWVDDDRQSLATFVEEASSLVWGVRAASR